MVIFRWVNQNSGESHLHQEARGKSEAEVKEEPFSTLWIGFSYVSSVCMTVCR